MKNVKRLALILAPIALLCGVSASAADSGFYIGLGFGSAKYDVEEGVTGLFATTATSRTFDSDSSWSLAAGYRLNPYVGFEASYINLGKLTYSETGSNTGPVSSGALDADVSSDGIGLALVGAMPIGGWDIHAKLGVFAAKTETSVVVRSNTLLQQSGHESASSTELMYGLGVGYTIAEHYNFSIDWTEIPDVGDADIGEGDVSVVSVEFKYRF